MSDSFATSWTVVHQAPLSMGFPSQEYWSGLPFPFPGALSNTGITFTSAALADGFFTTDLPDKTSISDWKWSCSVVSDSLQPRVTVAHQAPPSTRFSRQEYWSGLPFPSPGDLPKPGIKPRCPALQAHAGRCFNLWATKIKMNQTHFPLLPCL